MTGFDSAQQLSRIEATQSDVYHVETAVSAPISTMMTTQPLTFEQYLELDNEHVEVGRFTGSALLQSPQLKGMGIDFSLTAKRILDAVK